MFPILTMARLLCDENNGSGAGGSGGDGGAKPGDKPAGGNNLAGGNGAGGGGNPPPNDANGGGGAPAEVVGKGTFYEGLERELFTDPALKPFLDADGKLDGKNIIKSYVHTKRQFGRNKIAVPGEGATADDWKEVAVALGLPSKDAYKLKPKKDGLFEAEFLTKFQDALYGANILPNQAQQLLDWYADEVTGMEKKTTDEVEATSKAAVEGLQKEWGQAFDRNFLMAKKAFEQFATPELIKSVNDEGLGTSPTLQRLFYNVAKSLNEDTFKGDALPKGVLSPDEAQREINDHMTDPKGAYLNSQHPGHDQAVQRVNKLYEIIG